MSDEHPAKPIAAKPDATKPIAKSGSPLMRVILPIGLVACLGAGGVRWWHQSQEPAAVETPDALAGLTPELQRYFSATPSTAETFTEEVRRAADTLTPDRNELRQQVRDEQQRLRDSNPHLARAISSGLTAPLVGPEGGTTVEQYLNAHKPPFDDLIQDYLANATGGEAQKIRVGETIREYLRRRWMQMPEEQALTDALQAAYDSGNRDPLLLYAVLLDRAVGSGERFKLAGEAVEAIASRKTCPLLVGLITPKLTEFRFHMTPAEFVLAQLQARNDLFNAIRENATNDPAVTLLVSQFNTVFESMNGSARGDLLVEAVARSDEELPRWLKHYIASLVLGEIASHHRGEDYISNVPPEDLIQFEKFADLETQQLLSAWTLRSSSAFLCRRLLSNEMRSGTTGTSVHDWFRYAIAIASDDYATYQYYANALYPRWGGSESELMRLAELCVAHDDPNSLVPLYYELPVIDIINSRLSQIPLDANLQLAAIAVHVVDYLKKSAHPRKAEYFTARREAMLTRILWDNGRFDELKWVLDNQQLPARTDLDAVASAYDFQVNYPLMTAFCAAMNAGNREQLRKVHHDLLLHSKDLDPEKIEAIKQVLTEIREGADQQTASMLNTLDHIIRWADAFHRGEKVNLDMNEELEGWAIWGFDAEPVKNGFEVTVPIKQRWGTAIPLLRFPIPHSFEAEVELVSNTVEPFGIGIFAGPMGAEPNFQAYNGMDLRYRPSGPEICIDQLPGNQWSPNSTTMLVGPAPPTPICRLRVEVRETGIQAFVNDEPAPHRPGPVETQGVLQLSRDSHGIFNDANSGESVFRLTNIHVQRLDEPVSE